MKKLLIVSFAFILLIGLVFDMYAKKGRSSLKPDAKIAYKKVEKGQLNLYMFYPENFDKKKPVPVVVFFFGGGWTGGHPSQFYTQAKYLASRGIIGISAQYRTMQSHKTSPSICVEDGRSAIRYVREHAAELGIIPNKIAAGGGSAGGHVAAATATVTKFDSPDDNLKISAMPDALVLFNPVYDNGADGYGYDRVKDYYKDISPMHNIHKDMPPSIVFFGDSDKHVPVKTAEKFQTLMKEKGVRSELHVYQNQKHGFFNLPRGGKESWIDIITKMDEFLKSLGFLKGNSNVKKWLEDNPEH